MINRYAIRAILKHLEDAQTETTKTDIPGWEGQATWHIRLAREQLLEHAIADVEVEVVPAEVV